MRNWTLGGGLQGALGFRWWFLPKSLALVGEFENRITETYTSVHANSRTETTTTATSYTSTAVKTTSVGSGTWALSATTYICALGLDAFF